MHSRNWGFDPSREGGVFSLWTAAPENKGGVAILLNPYSAITSMVPFQREKWSAHWMAVTVEIHGHSVLVVNCYAPSDATAREAYFESLLDVANSHDGPLFVGGDFNCTLYPHARTGRTTVRPVSTTRLRFVAFWRNGIWRMY